MMGKHKKVTCKVCYKEMRSDHLIRHMKQHSSALQTTEEICKDILLDQSVKVLDMQSVSSTKKKFEDNDSDEDLKKEMVRDNNEYKRKIKLFSSLCSKHYTLLSCFQSLFLYQCR